jgi:hypothetical protein
MSQSPASTGHATNQLAGTVGRQNPVRKLTDRLLPADLCWLPTAGLPHPEAARADELAFPFLIGRREQAGSTKTVREAELVVAAALAAGREEEQIQADLVSYARFVVACVPTVHARLGGHTLAAWQDANVRAQRGGD